MPSHPWPLLDTFWLNHPHFHKIWDRWDSGYSFPSTSESLILFMSDEQFSSHCHTTPLRALKLAKRQSPWACCSSATYRSLTLNCCGSAAQKILWSIMDNTLVDPCTLCAMCRHWSQLPWSAWLSRRGRCRKKCLLSSLFQYTAVFTSAHELCSNTGPEGNIRHFKTFCRWYHASLGVSWMPPMRSPWWWLI